MPSDRPDPTRRFSSRVENYIKYRPHYPPAIVDLLKEGCHVYTGAVIKPGITIGRWAEVGAQAYVQDDVPDYGVAVGIPAKVIKYREYSDV